jgi:quercetin dioxygenase-like cupin family protein
MGGIMRARFTPYLLVMLVLALVPAITVSAKGVPATPVPGDAPTGVLAEFLIDELPTPHAEVWFLRMELAPGGSLPAAKQVGPVVAYVESGTLTLVADQPVTVSTAGAAATPDTGDGSPAIETVLRPGDAAIAGDGTSLAITNAGDEPARFLVVSLYAAEREGESSDGGEPVGLTYQEAISIGVAEFPGGPGTLVIERVVAEPGATLSNDSGHGMGINGIELGGIEQGSAEATFEMGSSWLWPDIQTEFQDRQPIDSGATIDLTPGDGYYTFDGSSTWTVTSEEPLIVLRVVVMPAS